MSQDDSDETDGADNTAEETDETDGADDIEEVVSMYEQDEKVGPGDVSGPDEPPGDGPTDGIADETNSQTAADQVENDGDGAGMMPGMGGPGPGMGGPDSSSDDQLVQPGGGGETEPVTGTFYVKYAQDESVTLHDVHTAQICTLIENPGFERHDIVEATLKPQPPMEVSYFVEELENQYSIPAETSDLSVTQHVYDIATTELDQDEAVAIEREGKGEIHILRVDPERTATVAEELLHDETTYKNAAKFDHVERVEIRTDEEDGVISIRYLP